MTPWSWNPLNWLGWSGPRWLNTIDPAQAPAPTDPRPGEKTEQQNPWYGTGGALGGLGGYAGAPRGNYAIWRLMDRHPTLALARTITVGPILAGARSFEAVMRPGMTRRKSPITGDGVISDPLDQRAEWFQATMGPQLFGLIKDSCRALSLGHYPFEQIRDVRDGRQIIKQFKPLRPELCTLNVDRAGRLVRIDNGNARLGPGEFFNYANDPEAGYWYGTPRHENCREEWWEKLQAKMQGARLDQKAAGITMVVKGPPGSGKTDSNGKAIDGADAAQNAANAIANLRPVWVPKFIVPPPDPDKIGDPEYLTAYAKLAELTAFDFEQFDWGDVAPAASAILEKLTYIDIELMRAWHRPDREAMQAQHGAKADAEAHGQVGVTDSDLVHTDLCMAISQGPVNDLLAANWGEDARDSVYLKAAPIQDVQTQRLKDFLTTLLQNPQNATDLYNKVDKAKLLKSIEVDAVEGRDVNEEATPVVPPAVGTEPGANGKPVNGNGKANGVKLAASRLALSRRLFGKDGE